MRNTTLLVTNQPTKQKRARLRIVKDNEVSKEFDVAHLKANHKYFVHSLFCEMFDKI